MNELWRIAEIKLDDGPALFTTKVVERWVPRDRFEILLAQVQATASECDKCNGTGINPLSVKTWHGGIEVDNDDQPCDECAGIRAVIAKAIQP